ncbi:MAG TPA: GTP-binding protein [Stellaceae bacterium]|nr:GTP-binding protein [Stellaceae bacterium]
MPSLFTAPRASARIPVSLVTGFLGSGKTTLLNRLLRHPAMAATAIVINEFGEIALDQHFIERSDGEVVVMANGCLCCTVQGDFEAVVGTLYARADRGEIPAFDRLLIETTGLADPAPIMQILLGQPLIAETFALDAVVTTVDALFGLRQLDEHEEAVKQAALADRLVVTKTDLADASALIARLRHLNPGAEIARVPGDDVGPAQLFGAALVDRAGRVRDVEAWLGARHEPHGHLHGVESFALVIERPVEWRHFQRWLTRLKVAHADHLLRVKGILRIEGEDAPVAIHGVHHVFHPPVALPHLAGDGPSRLVFITRGLDRDTVERDWRDFAEP